MPRWPEALVAKLTKTRHFLPCRRLQRPAQRRNGSTLATGRAPDRTSKSSDESPRGRSESTTLDATLLRCDERALRASARGPRRFVATDVGPYCLGTMP